jgi:tetratricopeptide (TPR) repeat protein
MIRVDFCRQVRMLRTPLFTLFLGFAASSALAQTQNQTQKLSDKISQDRELIHIGERDQSSNAHQGYLWAHLAADYRDGGNFSQSEDAYNRSLQLLKTAPEAMANYATTLDNLGALYLTYARTDDARNCMQKALAIRQQLGDHTNIAVSLQHLADLDVARRKFKDAETEASEAYQTLSAPGVPNGPGTISALLTLAFARCKEDRCAQGIQDAEHALDIARTTLRPDSVQLGIALVTLGFAQWKAGQPEDAEKAMRSGLKIIKDQTAPGDPTLAYSLMQYRDYLHAMRRTLEAKQVDAQLAAASHQPCNTCSVSVHSLANTMR